MPGNNIDLYRAAKLYIDQHGDQAAFQAAMQSDALLDAGDPDGAATWRGIIMAIKSLQVIIPSSLLTLCNGHHLPDATSPQVSATASR